MATKLRYYGISHLEYGSEDGHGIGVGNCCGAQFRANARLINNSNYGYGLQLIGDKVFEEYEKENMSLKHIETKQGTLTLIYHHENVSLPVSISTN